jgi:hypothetical protein
MQLTNNTGQAVQVNGIDFAVNQTKGFPDDLPVPHGFSKQEPKQAPVIKTEKPTTVKSKKKSK